MNLLILGALPKTEEERKLYECMINCCSRYSSNVSSPLETATFRGDNDDRFEIAMRKVALADLLIGEQSKPSTGQGFELGVAYSARKPFVVLTKDVNTVSGLIKGCPNLREILLYTSLSDLDAKLDNFLSHYKI